MDRKYILIVIIAVIKCNLLLGQNSAIDSLAMRVTNGTSENKILFRINEISDSEGKDFFKIIPLDDKRVLIEGNNIVSQAVGLNHYLKYFAGIHICWNNPKQNLPAIMPLPEEPIYRETNLKNRYYLNYCTFSYSMPFWNEERWMNEIDWMALHGINMPLSLTGIEVVWKNILSELCYTGDEIGEFISGPAYFAWWQMNNLEGWGGPLPSTWYENREQLQKKIVDRMRSLDIMPVLPGYSGMVPRNFAKKTGHEISDPGLWCGFNRPAFLSPEDSIFQIVADLYYKELTKLYGTSQYYSMDPFHEGGNTGNVNLTKAGNEIYSAMKRANKDAKWVIQSWQSNPKRQMIDSIPQGDLIILDLYSEKIPKWERIGGYGNHEWLYCMLLNFGGNIGMHGRINSLTDGFSRAKNSEYGKTLTGIGATPEGIDNNPIMYELLFELPWIESSIDIDHWINKYLTARYGKEPDKNVRNAWTALYNTVYNAPVDYPGEGTVESLICARPSWFPKSASTWGNSLLFYSPDSTAKAAELMEISYPIYGNNNNFQYDYIDIKRQANADKANRLINEMSVLFEEGRTDSVKTLSDEFLKLLLEQDSLLSLRTDTHVNSWLGQAEQLSGNDQSTREKYLENAATLITVWGDSIASNSGGLHDYSHREWGGIIKELYYPRWKAFFEHELYGGSAPDFYTMEKEWVRRKSSDAVNL